MYNIFAPSVYTSCPKGNKIVSCVLAIICSLKKEGRISTGQKENILTSIPLCKRACLTKIYRTLGRQYNPRLRAMQIPVGVKWAHLHGSINNTSCSVFHWDDRRRFLKLFFMVWRENTRDMLLQWAPRVNLKRSKMTRRTQIYYPVKALGDLKKVNCLHWLIYKGVIRFFMILSLINTEKRILNCTVWRLFLTFNRLTRCLETCLENNIFEYMVKSFLNSPQL